MRRLMPFVALLAGTVFWFPPDHLGSAVARADDARFTAYSCRDWKSGGATRNVDGSYSNSSTSLLYLTCAFRHEFVSSSAVEFVNVHANDQSTTTGVFAAACSTYELVTGGSCGPYESSSGTGNKTIQLSDAANELDQWNVPGANDYLEIVLPGDTASAPNSQLYGFAMWN